MTMTLDEFVAWEQTQDGRHELEDGQIIALPGGNEAHSAIRANLLTAAGAKLRGSGCHTLASSMLVRTGNGNLRRPDLTIDCGLYRADALIAPNPTVVVEVLSADSEIRDRTRKLGDYNATPTIQHYVLIEQDVMLAHIYCRGPQGDFRFQPDKAQGPDGVIRLPAIGISLTMAEVYSSLDFG